VFNGLRAAGVSLTTMAWIAVPLSAVWWLGAVMLGRNAARRQRQAVTAPSAATRVNLDASVSR
jgi:type IV secretory pathway TrbD component